MSHSALLVPLSSNSMVSVAFAVERREEEDEDAQHDAAHRQLLIGIFQFGQTRLPPRFMARVK